MIGRSVPAGFQGIEINVRLDVTESVDPAQIKMLTTTAEQCCVVLQTLRSSVPVTTTFADKRRKA